MGLLQRYISKTILTNIFLVLVILLALYSFMDFVGELDDLGKGHYQLSTIARYMLLSMPKRIYELLPVAALLGAVLGLGNLANQSELVVMRAAGLSVQQINNAVMIVAVFLMVVVVLIGEVVRPLTEHKARKIQSLAQKGNIAAEKDEGFWTRDGPRFNHIGRIMPDGGFENIVIYEFDEDNQLRIVTKAEGAQYDGAWLLTGVTQSAIDEQGVKTRTVENARWKSKLDPGMLNIIVVPPEFLPVWRLLAYIDYLKDNYQAVERYTMAFWIKVMTPISSAVMVFLAVPFIFGPLRSTPIGGRIMIGVLTGIGFHLVNQIFQHVGLVFGIFPWLAASMPTLFFALLGWYSIKRIH